MALDLVQLATLAAVSSIVIGAPIVVTALVTTSVSKANDRKLEAARNALATSPPPSSPAAATRRKLFSTPPLHATFIHR